MIYTHEVELMCPVAQGVHHGAAPIPEEGRWVKSKEISDISGLTHGVRSTAGRMQADPECKGWHY